jgi:hypothetical protein
MPVALRRTEAAPLAPRHRRVSARPPAADMMRFGNHFDINPGGAMAAWVQAGNRKLNLDRASWIDRSDDGAVHVIFDGALNHTFRGPAAESVWEMITAKDSEPKAAKSATAKAPRARKQR